MRLADGQLLDINEFLHPRIEEIADGLPAGAGRWLLASKVARPLVERLTRDGKIVRTSSLRGFLLMYSLAGLAGSAAARCVSVTNRASGANGWPASSIMRPPTRRWRWRSPAASGC